MHPGGRTGVQARTRVGVQVDARPDMQVRMCVHARVHCCYTDPRALHTQAQTRVQGAHAHTRRCAHVCTHTAQEDRVHTLLTRPVWQ